MLINNKKGMTLIELIVVMLISVVLMGIAGSILLSSTGFFTKATITDQDKLATDKIAEFVNGEIMYATNVIVTDTKQTTLDNEEDWHYFKFANGRVYHDSEDMLALSDSYYANRNLVVKAEGYDNSYRLDLTYLFNNTDGETEYTTKTTIAFPNLKLQYDNGINPQGWFNLGKILDSSGTKILYIYYNRNAIDIKTDTGYGGTVADQIQCKTDLNDRGAWDSTITTGPGYNVGDFVYLCSEVNENPCKEENQVWYRLVYSSGKWSKPNGGEIAWKRITATFNDKSDYYRGDVTLYDDKYYLMYFAPQQFKMIGNLQDNLPGGRYSLFAPVQVDVNLVPYCETGIEVGDTRYTHAYVIDSPAYRMYESNIDKTKITIANAYVKGTSYPSVKSKFDNNKLTASDIVENKGKYYVNLSSGNTYIEPGSAEASNIWYCLDNVYSPNSMYFAGDIVSMDYNDKKTSALFRAKINISNGAAPDVNKDTGAWERVYFNLETGKYTKSN